MLKAECEVFTILVLPDINSTTQRCSFYKDIKKEKKGKSLTNPPNNLWIIWSIIFSKITVLTHNCPTRSGTNGLQLKLRLRSLTQVLVYKTQQHVKLMQTMQRCGTHSHQPSLRLRGRWGASGELISSFEDEKITWMLELKLEWLTR